MPIAKVVSLKMPSLPSPEVRGRIELSSRVARLREAGIEFDMKCRELDQLYQTAINDLFLQRR
jgi:hypothetical protein